MYGTSRNLIKKFNTLVYEENYKNDLSNESSTSLNKKFGSS